MENNLTLLINKLQKCLEIKYPTRKWSETFYNEAITQWSGKEKELEERVKYLESE